MKEVANLHTYTSMETEEKIFSYKNFRLDAFPREEGMESVRLLYERSLTHEDGKVCILLTSRSSYLLIFGRMGKGKLTGMKGLRDSPKNLG